MFDDVVAPAPDRRSRERRHHYRQNVGETPVSTLQVPTSSSRPGVQGHQIGVPAIRQRSSECARRRCCGTSCEPSPSTRRRLPGPTVRRSPSQSDTRGGRVAPWPEKETRQGAAGNAGGEPRLPGLEGVDLRADPLREFDSVVGGSSPRQVTVRRSELQPLRRKCGSRTLRRIPDVRSNSYKPNTQSCAIAETTTNVDIGVLSSTQYSTSN